MPAWLLPAALMMSAHAADVQVIGVFGAKATLVIDGGRPRTLSIGETTPEKIRLVSVSGDSAVIESGGRRHTVQMGQAGQRIGGGQGGSGTQRVTLTADDGTEVTFTAPARTYTGAKENYAPMSPAPMSPTPMSPTPMSTPASS